MAIETNNIKEKQKYQVFDYANDIFGEVTIIENNPITGDIIYRVCETNEVLYFSGSGYFDVIKNI